MTRASNVATLIGCLLLACVPELPIPEEQGSAPELEMFLEPDGAESNAAPVVLRARLSGPGAPAVDPSDVFLARGTLTERNLEDLSAGFITEALGRRLLPATVFASDGDVVIVPHGELEALESYSVGVASHGLAFPLRTSVAETAPLARRWPVGEGVSAGHLFFCGADALADGAWPASLEPAGIRGTFYVGAPSGRARQCLRFDPAPGQKVQGFGHPPPAVNGRSLDPAPVDFGWLPPGVPVTCDTGQTTIAHGCLLIEDDRVFVRSSADALWVVGIDGAQDTIAFVPAGSRFVVRGLSPSSVAALRVETLTSAGWEREDVTVHTQPPRARPVLNEVYANALGPEPGQEWIEIVNDGTDVAVLRGLAIEDVGGRTELPVDAPDLPPGGHVVIAPVDIDTSGLYDVPIGPEVTIVRVEALGKNGLSNSGELLRLVDPTGAVLSVFPARKYESGQSIARAMPWSLEEDPTAFVVASPTPGDVN